MANKNYNINSNLYVNDGNINEGSNNTISASTNSNVFGNNNSITSANTSNVFGILNNVSDFYNHFVAGAGNNVSGSFGTSTFGGINTSAQSNYSTIFGRSNTLTYYSSYSSIINGTNNSMNYSYNSVVGGKSNTINNSRESVIIGGYSNLIQTTNTSFNSNLIGVGRNNRITGSTEYSSIVGGRNNSLYNNIYSTIVGGYNNTLGSSTHSTIGGGQNNVITYGYYTKIGGGYSNNIYFTDYTSIVGGFNNTITHSSNSSFTEIIGGGGGNTIEDTSMAFIGGGYGNTIDRNGSGGASTYSFIGGGIDNSINSHFNSFIGNGRNNTLFDGNRCIIVGGINNYMRVVSGGFIGGGRDNTIYGNGGISPYSFIGTGRNNFISGSSYSSVITGINNNLFDTNHSHIIGSNITSVSANTTHVERLNIGTIDNNESLNDILVRDTNGTIRYRSSQSIADSFTGNTSGACITDLWVTNVNSCSPLYINPSDQGNVFIGDSGFTFDIVNKFLGIGVFNPSQKLHLDGNILFDSGGNRDISVDGVTTTNGNDLTIKAGASTNLSGVGGDVNINGGDATVTGLAFGGNVNINGGFGGSPANVGDVILGTQLGSNIGINTSTPQEKLHVSGNTIISGNLDMGGVLSTNNDTLILNLLTPKNNLVIPETSFIRFSVSGTPITITGLSGGTDGKRIMIANVGVDDISFTHDDAGSVSVNRLLNGSLGATKTLSTNDTIEYIYDSVSQKWRYIGGSI